MNETNEPTDTIASSSTNKTGLFIGIIIVLLAIIAALGVYAYHLAHLPMDNRSAPPPLHRLQQHPMPQHLQQPARLTPAHQQPAQPPVLKPAPRPTANVTPSHDPFAEMDRQMQQMQQEMNQLAAHAFDQPGQFFSGNE